MLSSKLPKPSAVTAKDRTWGVEKSSVADAKRLIAGAKSGKIGKNHPLANDPAVWRRLMEDLVLC